MPWINIFSRMNLKYFSIAILTILPFSVSATQHIQITSSEAPPYSSATIIEKGYVNQIISCAFNQSDVEVEFVFMPWSRAYKEAQDGKFAASSYWYFDAKHQRDFLLSQPLNQEKIVFFRRKNDQPNNWKNLAEFVQLRLGLTRGYTYTKELWQHAQNNEYSTSIVTSDLQNLRMLLLERIDIFPVDEVIGWYILNSNFAVEQVHLLETMRPALAHKGGHLLFSKRFDGSNALLEAFNSGLEACQKEGLLEQYRENLILGYYNQKIP